MESKNIGYEIGKWYMVKIYYEVFIPAKFIGIRPCSKMADAFHDFPHPGEAVFENVKIWGNCCGFEGVKWEDTGQFSGRYTSFAPEFKPVSENELWAVKAIEEFQKAITGRKKGFSISLNGGFVFEGKIRPPKEKENSAGEYYAKCVDPKTGEKKEGRFDYDGKSESVNAFLLSKLPGWHIVSVKQQKIYSGIPPHKKEEG